MSPCGPVNLYGADSSRARARRSRATRSASRPTRDQSDPLAPPAGRRRRFRFSEIRLGANAGARAVAANADDAAAAGGVRQHPGSTTALRGLMASLALPSARPWRAMGMRIDLRGARAARRACAALCAAVGGRRAAADVDRLLVAIVCWWRTGDAGGAEDRRRAPATTGHRAAACDQHDTRRHTATSLMLLLLLRPPAAPRGSATGCSPKHGAERSAVKGPR